MGRAFTESELRLGADPIWILDLTLGGVVYRFATESTSIEGDGESYFYQGTLSDVDYSSALEFVSPDFEMPSASVVVTFKDDLAKRIAQGLDFGAASAQLALWIPSTEYSERQVLIEGKIDAPSYGAIGEPVTFSIEADWLRNTSMMPGALQAIESSAWANIEPNSEGAVYPIIIGAPGRQDFAGSPIYLADNTGSNKVGLIAAHPCTATSINVFVIHADGSEHAVGDLTVLNSVDGNGARYSYLDIPTAHYQADASYFAKWKNGGGGLINPYATGQADTGSVPQYLTGGGDLVRYLLHQSGAKVDDGRCAAAAGYLNFIQFEGFIGERVDVLEFLKSEILPLLPCSLRASSEGIYPVVWRYDAEEDDAVAQLTAGRDVFRDGLVDYASNEIANEITIRYRQNVRYNKLKKAVTVTGDLTKKTSGFLWRTDYAVASQTRYGIKALEIETEYITSRASAGRVINWMARAHCGSHRVITYSAPQTFGWLEVGDVIALSDADLSFVDQLVILQSIAWGETDLTFEFLLVADLPRDTIPTG